MSAAELVSAGAATASGAKETEYLLRMTASVVITSYNQRDFLVEAIDSALAQTRQPHEIVVADDGSDDGSPTLIADLEHRFPGLVRGVYQPSNVGIPRNRNAALDAVTGDAVALLDGDDLLHPRFIEMMLGALEADPTAGAAYSNYILTDVHKAREQTKFDGPQPTGDVMAGLARGRLGLMRAMLTRTDLMRRVGGMDPRFPKHDGYVCSLRLARQTRFAYVDECLVIKRDHPEGDSKSFGLVERRRYLTDVFEAVKDEIVHLTPAEQASAVEWWRNRLRKIDERIDAAAT